MKKFLAVLMAALMLFTGSAMIAFAADAEDPSEPESATEAESTYNTYEICQDKDFLNIKYMSAGNENATILLPGDHITTYKNEKLATNVDYYPDADAIAVSGWEPSDPENLAFSASGKVYFRDEFLKTEDAVIRGIDFTDFTIAYSEDNVFIGWAIKEYDASANTISVYGVWKKSHTIPSPEEKDDFNFILDFFYNLRKKFTENVTSPFFAKIRELSNVFLVLVRSLYDKWFNSTPAA